MPNDKPSPNITVLPEWTAKYPFLHRAKELAARKMKREIKRNALYSLLAGIFGGVVTRAADTSIPTAIISAICVVVAAYVGLWSATFLNFYVRLPRKDNARLRAALANQASANSALLPKPILDEVVKVVAVNTDLGSKSEQTEKIIEKDRENIVSDPVAATVEIPTVKKKVLGKVIIGVSKSKPYNNEGKNQIEVVNRTGEDLDQVKIRCSRVNEKRKHGHPPFAFELYSPLQGYGYPLLNGTNAYYAVAWVKDGDPSCVILQYPCSIVRKSQVLGLELILGFSAVTKSGERVGASGRFDLYFTQQHELRLEKID